MCTGAAVVSWLPIKDKTGRPGLHFEVHVAVIYDVTLGLTPQQCQGHFNTWAFGGAGASRHQMTADGGLGLYSLWPHWANGLWEGCSWSFWGKVGMVRVRIKANVHATGKSNE